MTTVIESDEFRQEVAELKADPIVQAMAKEVKDVPEWKLYHVDGTPKIGFMRRTVNEYQKRGGVKAKTLGSVARAITALNKEQG
jgi:hypothetical protein